MTTPTIHLNGTARADLANAFEEAYRGLTPAMQLFANASPNARDYYPQGPDAFSKARAEFEKHAAALKAAQDYLLEQFLAIEQ